MAGPLIDPLTEPAEAAPQADFFSSFEADDPQPTWTNTVEIGGDGRKKTAGVDGVYAPGIPGNITDQVTAVTASGEYTEAGEVKENLIDGEASTKWLVFESSGWVAFELAEPVAVVHYALTSANDAPERDPRDWTLQGSADGESWTDLDQQTGQEWTERFQTKEYRFENTQAYKFYRLDIASVQSGDILQLADLQLSNGDTTPPPPSDMKSLVDRGPSASPTAKARVGFTGVRAFKYSGRHLSESRGYSYNKVFEVDVPVTADTELSYLVFPQLPLDDLTYASTYTAVDLAFDDGTYLSELSAVDQHGVRLNPQAQGKSKTLSVNQWNHKTSRIGAVAAGKRVQRVLVAYDNPDGPRVFQGWYDDIRIGAASPAPAEGRLSDYVLTTRGTNSTGGFSRGNNIPATAVPHGFNFWTPMTNAGSQSWLYEYQRANNADNLPTLQAFTVSHEPSPWMGDRQTFQVMPSVASGTPTANRAERALAFRHANEVARPYYYGVRFENGLRTEIAPTDHAAIFRFQFPGDDASLVFDNVNNNGGVTLSASDGVVTGYSDVRSGLSTGATRLFVYATFDRPIVGSGSPADNSGRQNVTGFLRFDAGASRTVEMRIATSLLSVEQAKRNLELEIAAGDSFDSVKQRAQDLWDEKLGVIEIEGATQDQLVTFYSNLYRLFLYPNSGFENTGSADSPAYKYASPVSPKAGEDTPTRTGAEVVDGKVYVNNGFWDTYRTTWPAYALLTPSMAGELVDGFVQQYRDGGWISRWSSPGYANLMVGTSSDVAFADAYLKGVGGFDVESAYRAAVKNASVAPPTPNVGRKGLSTSIFLGYTTTDTGEGMSWAMDGYINDFGIANMAKALSESSSATSADRKRYKEEAEYFRNRALNYVNMFDKSVGFFQGRKPDGSWRLPADEFDPAIWGYDYTETNAWNMAFHVPHDGQGLANLYGGKAKLAGKLDEFFSTPETGSADIVGSYGGIIHEMIEARDVRMGMFGFSNQPAHHIAYMYDYAGQPWKTQEKVREVLSRLYLGSEIGQGYPGDEDNGEMSAWQVFSALGFYPLQMGSPYYAVGSPLFKQATVHLEGGRDLVVKAPSNSARNVYVQGLKVNGKRYGKTYLPHDLLARGGVLEFDLGPSPSRWGTGTGDAPPSLTSGSKVPRPLADLTGPGSGTPASPEVAHLFDNTSATQRTFDGSAFDIGYVLDKPGKAVFYTLTSGTEAGDPSSWVLEGSTDGTKWTTLDRREGEAFDWRLQTRPFKVEKPSTYSHYRIRVTSNSGESTTSLAEVELLG